MGVRLFWTIAILVPFAAIVWADYHYNLGAPASWLLVLALIVSLLGALELRPLLAPPELLPSTLDCLLGVSLVIGAAALPVYWPLLQQKPYPADCPIGTLGCTLIGLVLAISATLVLQMSRYRQPTGNSVMKAALAIFVAAYLGVCVSFLIWLRIFRGNEWGMVALVSTVAIVKIADAGAYVAGRSFGRRALSPLLSPKKTIEGAVGALITAVGVAVACRWLLVPQVLPNASAQAGSWLAWAVLGFLLGIAGMFGDLAESLMKRDAGQKDSGRWLPGLGGMLDLLDSLLFAAPLAYAAWAAGLVGPG